MWIQLLHPFHRRVNKDSEWLVAEKRSDITNKNHTRKYSGEHCSPARKFYVCKRQKTNGKAFVSLQIKIVLLLSIQVASVPSAQNLLEPLKWLIQQLWQRKSPCDKAVSTGILPNPSAILISRGIPEPAGIWLHLLRLWKLHSPYCEVLVGSGFSPRL